MMRIFLLGILIPERKVRLKKSVRFIHKHIFWFLVSLLVDKKANTKLLISHEKHQKELIQLLKTGSLEKIFFLLTS
jgi:hypothetical protein